MLNPARLRFVIAAIISALCVFGCGYASDSAPTTTPRSPTPTLRSSGLEYDDVIHTNAVYVTPQLVVGVAARSTTHPPFAKEFSDRVFVVFRVEKDSVNPTDPANQYNGGVCCRVKFFSMEDPELDAHLRTEYELHCRSRCDWIEYHATFYEVNGPIRIDDRGK